MDAKKRLPLIIMGVLIAAVGVVGVFLIGKYMNPEPVEVVVSNIEITAGTPLNSVNTQEDLLLYPIQAEPEILDGFVTPDEYVAMAENGLFIEDIHTGELLRSAAIVSADNPEAAANLSLGLTDPNMVVMSIPADDTMIPDNLQAGAYIDIVVAVGQVDEEQKIKEEKAAEEGGVISYIPYSGTEEGVDIGDPQTQVQLPNEGDGTEEEADELTFRAPLAKVLVHNARVVRVVREVQESRGIGEETETVYGPIQSVDILIPRDGTEWVAMAADGGRLFLAVLSPLAEDRMDQPTLGASVQDLLDIFEADRIVLEPDTVEVAAE